MSRKPYPPRFRIPLDRLKTIVVTAELMTEYLEEKRDSDAYGLVFTSGFSIEEQLFLWDLFDSAQRRRMKETNWTAHDLPTR